MARPHMIRREWTAVVLVALGAMTGAAADLHGTRPNIVLVMTDDQGYGDAGYMGHSALQTPVLDGVSLVPLLEGKMQQRPTPLGFWHHEGIGGRIMWSDQIVQELQAVLEAGGQGEINEGTLFGPDHDYRQLESSPGHSVWLDNPWKLHQLAGGDYLLFNLADDPGERNNVIAEHADRAERMKQQLRAWRDSCLHSLRGGDY